MSDADPDRVDARLTGIENTVEQLDTRVGRVEEQLDTLNGRMDGLNGRIDDLNQRIDDRFDTLEGHIARNRTEIRRELLVIAGVVTAILGGLQLVIAWGGV